MSGTQVAEILFALFAVAMTYVNLCFFGVTVQMLSKGEFSIEDVPAAAFFHTMALGLLVLGLWGVVHF